MNRDKRKKASDVFDETDYAFAENTTFARAFPQVAELRVDVQETDAGSPVRKRIYTGSELGEFVNCSNDLCYNGGVRMGEVIRSMVSNGDTEAAGSSFCQGYEGSPKGRKRYRRCLHGFSWTAQIKYKKGADHE